jgi:hypothetical protein
VLLGLLDHKEIRGPQDRREIPGLQALAVLQVPLVRKEIQGLLDHREILVLLDLKVMKEPKDCEEM